MLKRILLRCMHGAYERWMELVVIQKEERQRRRESNDRKVQIAVRKLLFRHLAQAFESLKVWRQRMQGVKRLVKQGLNRLTHTMYTRWYDFTLAWRLQHKSNNAKAAQVLFRILQREVAACFANMKLLWFRAKRVKAMLRRRLGGMKRHCFDGWILVAMVLRVSRYVPTILSLYPLYTCITIFTPTCTFYMHVYTPSIHLTHLY